MKKTLDYKEKFEKHIGNTLFHLLKKDQQEFILEQAYRYKFTFQELRKVIQYGRDLEMWAEGRLQDFWPDQEMPGNDLKIKKEKIIKHLEKEFYFGRDLFYFFQHK